MRKTFFTTNFSLVIPASSKNTVSDRLISLGKEWSWTIAWALFCAICLEYALQAREKEHVELQMERISLESQLQDALQLHKKLLQEMNSQGDPAWIELVLMKKLGLVPEGQSKVLFVPRKD